MYLKENNYWILLSEVYGSCIEPCIHTLVGKYMHMHISNFQTVLPSWSTIIKILQKRVLSIYFPTMKIIFAANALVVLSGVRELI